MYRYVPLFLLFAPLAAEEQPNPFGSQLWSVLQTLGLIIGALLLAAWAFKRLWNQREQQLNQTSEIKILERRMLAPKSAIYLLEVRGQGFIVGETPGGLHQLGNFEPGKSFGEVMQDG